MSAFTIYYPDPGSEGYHPVRYMVELASELLDAEVVRLPKSEPARIMRLKGFVPRLRGDQDVLLVCPAPNDLLHLLRIPGWRRQLRTVVAWVFDSFWTDRLPAFSRAIGQFDHIFVTERDDLDVWRQLVRASVTWLPWGTDALRLGSSNENRPVDLQRVGRQPPGWTDDAVTERACRAAGLTFSGRPPSHALADDNQRTLMEHFAQAKLSLSFSNRVSPGIQTHPKREYITARWTDALASGAVVAGVPPRFDGQQELLWPEALLDLGTTNVELGLSRIQDGLARWTPEIARINHVRALERLDWRWRFRQIADLFGLPALRLRAELGEVEAQVARERAALQPSAVNLDVSVTAA